MSEDNFQVDISIQCPECKQMIEFNYTEDDIFDNESLLFTCKCGYSEKIKTQEIIDKAMDTAEGEINKELDKMFKHFE